MADGSVRVTTVAGLGSGRDIRTVAVALRAALSSGAVARMTVPPRQTTTDAAGTRFISMPAVSPDHDLYINKVATIVDGGRAGGGATVTAVVPVFRASTGRHLATLDGAAVTELKCAAVTALVTARCAAADPVTLAVLGSGVQARQQVRAVAAVRDLGQVRIWSRTPAHAAAFARWTAAGLPGTEVLTCVTASEAARGADVVSTATTSVDPLPLPELPAHVHVNAMGAHSTASREVPPALLRSALVLVEDVATAVVEAGPSHAQALELDVLDTPAAAGFPHRRTVFASTGCAWLDLVTCAHLVDGHVAEGVMTQERAR